MTRFQNFSRLNQKSFQNYIARKNNIRFKADLAPTQHYKSVLDLSYASYQSTDANPDKLTFSELPAPLLILHGLLGSKGNFNSLCKRYHENSKRTRQVIAVDFRNHGDSAHSKDNTYDDMVMDVLRFLSMKELKNVSILGHDIGGRVGMLLALKYPELVEKLIVSDISPITTSHNFKVFPEILIVIKNMTFPPNITLQQAKAHAVNCLSRVIKNKTQMSFVLTNLVQKADGGYNWRFNNNAILRHFPDLSMFPEMQNVKYNKPVLFVGGSKSDYIQKSDFSKILKFFPKAELKYIHGAGHYAHSEKPSEFLKITVEFLNRKPAPF